LIGKIASILLFVAFVECVFAQTSSNTFTSFSEKVWTLNSKEVRMLLYFHPNGKLYKLFNENPEVLSWKYNILDNELMIESPAKARYIVTQINTKVFEIQQKFQQELLDKYTYSYNENSEQDFMSFFPEIKLKKKENSIEQEKPTLTVSYDTTKSDIYEISLTGGGFYNERNRVTKNFIQIQNDNWIISEFENESSGLVKRTLKTDAEDVRGLINFIGEKGFFTLPQNYICRDRLCSKVQKEKTPIPLRISVRYGSNYNIVQIAVYDFSGKYNYCQIPVSLQRVIDSILIFTNER